MSSSRPNVLVLLSDQHSTRFDGAETPALNDLAADGVSFESAYCPSPATTPSRVSLLTGQSVPTTETWSDRHPVPADVPTLADAFSEAGYETCAVGSLGLAGPRQFAGFDNRPYGDLSGSGGAQFDPLTDPTSRGSPNAARSSQTGGAYGHRYDPLDRGRHQPDPWRSLTEDAGETTIPESRRQERIAVEEARAFLRNHRATEDEVPWLLCASFASPAPPLTAPARYTDAYPLEEAVLPDVGYGDSDTSDHPFVTAKRERDRTSQLMDSRTVDLTDPDLIRRTRAAYAAAIAALDETIGDFLSGLDREGFLDNTVVIYASARGSMAGEHGLWWAGTWHEPAVRVPFIVNSPHSTMDARIEAPVSLIDLLPTLCDLTDIDAPDCEGSSLAASVKTGSNPERGAVAIDYFDTAAPVGHAFRALVAGDEKHVRFADEDALDLAANLSADPNETAAGSDAAVDKMDLDVAETARRARETEPVPEAGTASGTTGNGYLLDDQRVLDADATLYYVHIMAQSAPIAFEDHPSSEE